MDPIQKRILSTLALYSAEGRSALTPDEIHRYLHQRPTTRDEIMKQLAELKTSGLVFSDGDYYSLENSAGLVVENIKKARQSAAKIKKNKWPLLFLRIIPFARAVAITGSVAMNNASEKSDLDLLIIAKKGRVWTARLLALLILEIFGRRRENSREKICINYLLAEGAQAPIQNIASANLFARAIPIIGTRYFNEFLRNNVWIENYIGLAYVIEPAKDNPVRRKSLSKLGDWLERQCKEWQVKRLEKKITADSNTSHLILTDDIIMLHYPNPKNVKIMRAYNNITTKLNTIAF